jgi:hypothetical protein
MATLQEQLDEAIAVRHQLMLGKAVVSLQLDGRRMEYSKANLATLETYISQLRRQIVGRPVQRGRVTYVVPR